MARPASDRAGRRLWLTACESSAAARRDSTATATAGDRVDARIAMASTVRVSEASVDASAHAMFAGAPVASVTPNTMCTKQRRRETVRRREWGGVGKVRKGLQEAADAGK